MQRRARFSGGELENGLVFGDFLGVGHARHGGGRRVPRVVLNPCLPKCRTDLDTGGVPPVAPGLGVPTLPVDTTDGYRPDFDQIVSFARGRCSQ